MATSAHRLIQDQNLNILYNGNTPGIKANVVKPTKKGVGGRKALNDISSSRNASVLQSTKKENVISIEKDPCADKIKFVNAPQKGKVSGRKALGDLTNSFKPVSRTAGKLDSVAENNIPFSIAEERFLHNHQECIKAQMMSVDMDYFLKSVGLKNDIPILPPATRGLRQSSMMLERKLKPLEMEEMPAQMFGDPKYCSPACRSPKSPKLLGMNWDDDSFSDLRLIESPKQLLNR